MNVSNWNGLEVEVWNWNSSAVSNRLRAVTRGSTRYCILFFSARARAKVQCRKNRRPVLRNDRHRGRLSVLHYLLGKRHTPDTSRYKLRCSRERSIFGCERVLLLAFLEFRRLKCKLDPPDRESVRDYSNARRTNTFERLLSVLLCERSEQK